MIDIHHIPFNECTCGRPPFYVQRICTNRKNVLFHVAVTCAHCNLNLTLNNTVGFMQARNDLAVAWNAMVNQ